MAVSVHPLLPCVVMLMGLVLVSGLVLFRAISLPNFKIAIRWTHLHSDWALMCFRLAKTCLPFAKLMNIPDASHPNAVLPQNMTPIIIFLNAILPKVATEQYSQKGEIVEWHDLFICTGPPSSHFLDSFLSSPPQLSHSGTQKFKCLHLGGREPWNEASTSVRGSSWGYLGYEIKLYYLVMR